MHFYIMNREAPKRLMLKLSGEALKWSQEYGLDVSYLHTIADKIVQLSTAGYQLVIVLGAGNIFRGATGAELGLDRTTGDYMGMIATIINGMALGNVIEEHGVPTRIMSSLDIPRVAEPFIRKRAIKHLEKGRIVICVAGTGNPYFSTDSAGVLRWLELDCDIMVKWTKVDGIYDADPKKYPEATRFETLSYDKALELNLDVMDLSAIALAKDQGLPLFVCHLEQIDKLGTDTITGTYVTQD